MTHNDRFKSINNVNRFVKNGRMRINCVFDENGVEFVVLNELSAFRCKANAGFLAKYAEQMSKSVENYLNELENLTCDEKTEFFLDENKFVVYLKPNSNARVAFFSAPVVKVNYQETVEDLLEKSHLIQQRLLESNEEQSKTIEKMAEDAEKCANLFKKHVDATKQREDSLLNNFSLLLNAKKRRIQFLEEVIDSKGFNLPPENPSSKNDQQNPIEKLSESEPEQEEDEESDQGQDQETDQDKESNTTDEEEEEGGGGEKDPLQSSPSTSFKLPPRDSTKRNHENEEEGEEKTAIVFKKRSKKIIHDNEDEDEEEEDNNLLQDTVTVANDKTRGESQTQDHCMEDILNNLF